MSKNYVATTKDNLESVLKKIKDDDTLLLFYYDEHKTIDINMLAVFAKSRLNLELRKLPEENAEIFLAFELGKLASTGSVTSISEDEIVFGFSEYLNNAKTRKPREKKPVVANTNPVSRKRKPKTEKDQPTINPEEEKTPDDFDKAFDEFLTLLSVLKAPEGYDAVKHVQKIIETIKEVEVNKGNLLAVCTAVFGSTGKDAAYTFITTNYKKIKPAALRIIELDK